jgi:hypothetical protein
MDKRELVYATLKRLFALQSLKGESATAVIRKLGGAPRSGARNTESGGRKNYGNAPKLNYQLMSLSIYLLSLQNP